MCFCLQTMLVVVFDTNKQTWYGINYPGPNYGIYSISSNILNNTNYLIVTGDFFFEYEGNFFDGYAMYNLEFPAWESNRILLSSSSANYALVNNTGDIIICGDLYYSAGGHSIFLHGAVESNIYENPPMATPLGAPVQFPPTMLNLALFTNSSMQEIVFAAGILNNGAAPWAYIPLSNPNANWTIPGQNGMYAVTYMGKDVIYLTGGKGLNGINV